MGTEAKSRLGLTRYRDNPSIQNFETDNRTKLKRIRTVGNDGKTSWCNSQSGEVIGGGAMLFETEEVDVGKFVKLYTAGVARVAELIPAGAKMLEIVINEMKHDSDVIFLNSKVVAETYEISIPTIKRGLKDLREKEVLFDHFNGDGWFFINVAYIFKGDRYVVVKEYRVRSNNIKQVENDRTPQLPLFDDE